MSPRQRISIAVPLVGLATYWVICFALTHVPASLTPRVRVDWLPHPDKVAHFVLYAGLTFLLSWVFQRLVSNPPLARSLALVVALIYGGVDEYLQQFIPTRSMDFWDWVADGCGALAGVFTFHLSWLAWSAWNRHRHATAAARLVSRSV